MDFGENVSFDRFPSHFHSLFSVSIDVNHSIAHYPTHHIHNLLSVYHPGGPLVEATHSPISSTFLSRRLRRHIPIIFLVLFNV
jgi:hypothetical protein